MYRHYIPHHFKKQLKPYLKKFRGLIDDIIRTLESFDQRQHAPLGASTYKVRLRSRDLLKGSNKSFRLIILLLESDNLLVPLALYFKSDQATISKEEILTHIQAVKQEIVGL